MLLCHLRQSKTLLARRISKIYVIILILVRFFSNQRNQPDQMMFCIDNGMLLLSLESQAEEGHIQNAWDISKNFVKSFKKEYNILLLFCFCFFLSRRNNTS